MIGTSPRAKRDRETARYVERLGMDATDEELVQLCAQQLPYDTSAFEVLLRRHEDIVHRTCVRYLGSPHEADDAGQEIFMRVFHSLKKFKAESTFRTWLYRIVVNVCLTNRKKKATEYERRQKYQDDRVREIEAGTTTSDTGTAEARTRMAMEGPVGQALDTLSEDDRAIIVLRSISELSIQELAATFNIGNSAAKMRLKRAQDRFREAYEKQTGRPPRTKQSKRKS